ncbi:MTOR-associated protein MEAK7 [Spea bombifrons]|uniref:MTOR-associated protein MEAK7 n=1 Tax=Spea bombifrons TaxID=233779 RepID=UPI00234A77E9|nr:MTOR-associated protein MEAK7 [Spea bombifrons]
MGNVESGSYRKRLSRVSPAEQSEMEQSFESFCRGKSSSQKTVDLQTFQESIGNALPASMSGRIFKGIQSVNTSTKTTAATAVATRSPGAEIGKEQFVLFVVDVIRGTAEEKGWLIFQMISPDNSENITGRQVQQFSEDLIAAVVHVLKQQKLLNGWTADKNQDRCLGISALAAQLLSQLKSTDLQNLDRPELLNSVCSRASIEDWLYKVPMVSTFLRVVTTLGLSILKNHTEHQGDFGTLVPKCRIPKKASFVSLIDLPAVIYLNSHLPSEVQHKWRLLFSSQLHGESFSQLCGNIVDQGPCLLIIKDSDGFIFGGFASQSWEVKPQFQGDSRCFLFTVSPCLEVHTYTGYNEHYMYLNHGQQTMPNGLGMGGQHNYFGLWIDSNFGSGHSKAKPRCTTYNSPQLSAKEDFSIDALEVWAVGDLPEHLLAKNKKSILDADPEARALLEMTGRTRQSDGLRDPGDEDQS